MSVSKACLHVQAKQNLMKREQLFYHAIPHNTKALWRICLDPVHSPAACTTKPSVVVIFELAALAASGSVRKQKIFSGFHQIGYPVTLIARLAKLTIAAVHVRAANLVHQ